MKLDKWLSSYKPPNDSARGLHTPTAARIAAGASVLASMPSEISKIRRERVELMSRVLRGSKFGKAHSTYIPDAEPMLIRLKDDPNVKKVFLGEVKPAGSTSGTARVKVARIEGNLYRVSFRGTNAVQEFRIVTNGGELNPGDIVM